MDDLHGSDHFSTGVQFNQVEKASKIRRNFEMSTGIFTLTSVL